MEQKITFIEDTNICTFMSFYMLDFVIVKVKYTNYFFCRKKIF